MVYIILTAFMIITHYTSISKKYLVYILFFFLKTYCFSLQKILSYGCLICNLIWASVSKRKSCDPKLNFFSESLRFWLWTCIVVIDLEELWPCCGSKNAVFLHSIVMVKSSWMIESKLPKGLLSYWLYFKC